MGGNFDEELIFHVNDFIGFNSICFGILLTFMFFHVLG
jgi:hypothetical protein